MKVVLALSSKCGAVMLPPHAEARDTNACDHYSSRRELMKTAEADRKPRSAPKMT